MLEKNAFTIRMTPDMLAMRYGGDWMRKAASRTETPPSEEQWRQYREACALLERLEDNPYWQDGGPEYSSSIEEPRPRVHYEYAETEDEWLDRISRLNPADYEPSFYEALRRNVFVNLDSGNLYQIDPSPRETP